MTATALLDFKQRIDRLTPAEKLQLMEVLWDGISRDDPAYESPVWHVEELQKTEERVAAGLEEVLDWDDVKKRLRDKRT